MTKIEIARRQLGTALYLFLKDLDSVSVHALACGGGEVAEHLSREAGAKPFSTHILSTFPEMNTGDVRRLRNQYWNAFKHATTKNGQERKDEELLDRFSDEQNDHALFIGWHDLMLASGQLPIEAQVFQIWYFAQYPEKLNPATNTTQFTSVFPDLKSRSRAEQKRKLRETIEWAQCQNEVMKDIRTDKRPLVFAP